MMLMDVVQLSDDVYSTHLHGTAEMYQNNVKLKVEISKGHQ